MLFNSYEFIFAFLPATVVVFFLLGSTSRVWALRWLIAASLFFYAWWRPFNVLILAPSLLVNFLLARLLLRRDNGMAERRRTMLLVAGIVFNVAFLGYFKYANFGAGAVNDAFGTNFVLAQIVLPLGISFITFQKIAFLVDVHARRIQPFTFQDYCLFVLFFPQLIAGPIVHFRELMPQFRATTCRYNAEDVSVGLTLFVFGLFKKVFLADSIAPLVTALYEHAATGNAVSLIPAWMAAVGFTLQVYFDFSGYTDMALGAARLFGVRLPPNFSSPLQASSIIEFWSRWHMSLTRFLTAYIYNPVVLALTRRRLARGVPMLGGRRMTIGSFVQITMMPLMLTMVVSGLWHGAGYLFIVWGILHGLFLTVNHAWRQFAPQIVRDSQLYGRLITPVGFALTFLCVATSMVFFRAPTVDTSINLAQGLMGLNGVGLERESPIEFVRTAQWILALLAIALLCPSTLQIMERYGPALDWKPGPPHMLFGRFSARIAWSASWAWAVMAAAAAIIAVLHLGGQSEFLYWQF